LTKEAELNLIVVVLHQKYIIFACPIQPCVLTTM